MRHQYIDRRTSEVKDEKIFADKMIQLIYSSFKENADSLYNAAISGRMSSLLGFLNYDFPLANSFLKTKAMIRNLRIDLSECLLPDEGLDTARKLFERKIRYWECRPMPEDPSIVVSPADAYMLAGSFSEISHLFLKDKFFSYDEMFVADETREKPCRWTDEFRDGDFAVFRLTPDKYHYNHAPVSGKVLDIYEIPGVYHSCNPAAVIEVVTPFSKNKRVVTIVDTDVAGGSGVGLVAMIEVVALMIGDIVQCYSDHAYDDPREVRPGMFLKKGQPKSLYRPGSSTDVLVFQKDKIKFCEDIVRNMFRMDANSRFSSGFGRPLVETSVVVRSAVACRRSEQ
jgi:phosphatidylserine decarboxylase